MSPTFVVSMETESETTSKQQPTQGKITPLTSFVTPQCAVSTSCSQTSSNWESSGIRWRGALEGVEICERRWRLFGARWRTSFRKWPASEGTCVGPSELAWKWSRMTQSNRSGGLSPHTGRTVRQRQGKVSHPTLIKPGNIESRCRPNLGMIAS